MFIDKTYNEIKEASESGLCVMLYKHEDGVVPNYTTCAMLREYWVYDGAYYVIFHEPQDALNQDTAFRSLDSNTSML